MKKEVLFNESQSPSGGENKNESTEIKRDDLLDKPSENDNLIFDKEPEKKIKDGYKKHRLNE